MTANKTLTIPISAATLLSVITYLGYWGIENIATKADIQKLNDKLTAQYLELRMTTEEDRLRFLDDIVEGGEALQPGQLRRYEQLKESLRRLLVERDKLLKIGE